MAALADYLDSFDSGAKIRGKTYFKAGRVVDLAVAGPEVRGVVQGSFDYDVVLACTRDGWKSFCACPLGADCKHAFATGLAWLRRHDAPAKAPAGFATARAEPVLRLNPGEQPLIDAFTQATGHAPDCKQLAWLRALAELHRSVQRCAESGSSYGYAWFDQRALVNLAATAARPRLPYDYRNPFDGWWSRPPATAFELWPFVALLFTERDIPLPAFAAPFTRLDDARAEREKTRREAALKVWRERFAQLDHEASLPVTSGQPHGTLRLRLAPRKWTWEISPAGPAGPFAAAPAQTLTQLLQQPAHAALTLDEAGNAFLTYLRANYHQRGRTSLAPTHIEDCTLLGHLLDHPATRARLVNAAGEPLRDDPRRLSWLIEPAPADPESVVVRLALEDGSAPAPALTYVPAHPSLVRYLTPDGTLFRGPPPPAEPSKTVSADGFATLLPRAALALPEAGRFAARSGLSLPGDASGRFRTEPLRARLRAALAARRADYASGGEVLTVALHALAPGDEPRARWNGDTWDTRAPSLVRPADAVFLLHDYGPLQPAVDHLHRFPGLWFDSHAPGGGRFTAEISGAHFPEAFAAWLAAVPPGVPVELDPDLAGFAAPPTRAHFALEIEESDIDWFDVQVKLRVEDTTLTAEEIALLRQAKGRFIRLRGRGWRRLEIASDPAVQSRLERLGLEPATLAGDAGREAQKFHALQLADDTLGETLPEKLRRQIHARAAEIRATPAPAAPAGLHAELRPYQVEGFHFLAHLAANRFGGVLADDMGLGKTLQALAWLLWLADRKTDASPLRALVVCPKSVVFNWQSEAARFAPSLATARLTPRAQPPVPREAHLVVINYTQLRLHAATLAAETWDAVILDEGQNIKNPASATAAAARALRAPHRLVLTGTPVENRLLDLWSLFAFAQPGLLGGQTAFQRLYDDRENPAAAHARLATRVRHFLLRRTKQQVARDLPPRSEEDIVVELEGPQRKLYDAELKRARQLLLGVTSEREFATRRFNLLQSLLRLRQICCDPRLLGAPPGKTASAKLEALLDTLEPLLAEGHRVLVFSQFVTMLELIRDELAARAIRHLTLTGQTENRQELVAQFQAADGPPVFLLSLKAAGSGLNLTAASYVVLYDPWWNPAVEAQAIDRTHRIGQTAHVIAYRLLARDTVEEKIRALQKEKAALAAAVVQEESLAKVLDLDSLRRILA